MAVYIYSGRRAQARRVYGGDLRLLRRHVDATDGTAVFSGLFPGTDEDQLRPAAVILTDADAAEFHEHWFGHADTIAVKFDRYLRSHNGTDMAGQPFDYVDVANTDPTRSPWASYARPAEVLKAPHRLTARYGRWAGRERAFAPLIGRGAQRTVLILIALIVAAFLAATVARRPAALAGVLPAAAWMAYLRRQDRVRPESRGVLGRAALMGVVATLPIILIEGGLGLVAPSQFTPLGAIATAFLVAAAVEESGKALCLWSFRSNPEFDERFDGIVYAGWIGLGFASVENVLYLSGAPTSGAYLTTFVMRSVLAVPNHAIWAGLVGYQVARKRFDDRGANPWGALALAITLHGLYDAGPLLSIAMAHQDSGSPALRGIIGLVGPIAVTVVGVNLILRQARAALAADAVEARQWEPVEPAEPITRPEPPAGAGGWGSGAGGS